MFFSPVESRWRLAGVSTERSDERNRQRSKILFKKGSDLEHILEGTWVFIFWDTLPETSISPDGAFRPIFRGKLCVPIGSMFGIFTYIWHKFMVNVGRYTSPMDPVLVFGSVQFSKCLVFLCSMFRLTVNHPPHEVIQLGQRPLGN